MTGSAKWLAAVVVAGMLGCDKPPPPPPQVTAEESAETEFLMLKDGGVGFEGSAAELRASRDPYIQSFLS